MTEVNKLKTQTNMKQISKNIIYSIAAQVMAMLVNIIFGLVVPKLIDEYQYAYWQTYVLYVGYAGILHFGIIDGILLRYAQYDYNQLDKPRLRSQFQLLQIINIICAIIVSVIVRMTLSGPWQIIGYLVAVGIVTKNMFTYSYYILQCTNRIQYYSLFIIIQKIVYSTFVVVLLATRVTDFYWYCVADIVGDIIAIYFGLRFNRGLYYGKGILLKDAIRETKENAAAGIMLLVANFSSQLLVGSAKMITQWRWDELVFSKVSFAFSLSNMFLVFVNAISVVLFPSLKRMDPDKLPQLYKKLRDSISPILFIVLIFYFPGSWVLSKWLPKYEMSITYLGVLLPIIIFTTKVSLLTNNYLKAYRKEKEMLKINVLSVVIAVIMFLIAAYGLSSIDTLLIFAVLAIMGRSIWSEIVVMRIINISFYKEFIVEGIITVLFILIAKFFSIWTGMALYAIILAIYLIMTKTKISNFKRGI